MKHLALTLSIAFFVAAATDAAPVIFIVRHAEKATTGGNDPDLSVAGQKRAEALARILKDSQITAVFVTEFKRTQETAAPTAKAAHVNATLVSANDVAGLACESPCIERQRAGGGSRQHHSRPNEGSWDHSADHHSRG